MSEVLRALPMARSGARAFINCYRRLPIAAGVSGIPYPTQEEIEHALAEQGVSALFVPEHLPRESYPHERAWQAERINMLMLGVFCRVTQLLPRPALEEAIALRLPSLVEQNMQTFEAGWQYAKKALQRG
jgi:Pyruvate/2-oxoacid:ferredoxin oxidoreductase gamma subunit